MNNKKAKKSFCPRASTGNTHHGMRYAGEKLFSKANISNFGRREGDFNKVFACNSFLSLRSQAFYRVGNSCSDGPYT